METTLSNLTEFASDLGLPPEGDGSFVGKLHGFPVGLRFIDPAGAALLLFEIRHWLKADAPQLKLLVYDEEITELLAGKQIEIEFDEQKAWLTINDRTKLVESDSVARILNSVLQTFAQAGLIGDPELCHYCQKEKAGPVTSIEGKVVQICPACLTAKNKKRDVVATTSEAVPIFLMTPAAALVGAVLWALAWILVGLAFESSGDGTIYVPTVILIGVMVVIGLTVGGPIGWIIKQNRRRGHVVSTVAAILFGSAAVFAGELFYLVWLIYHQFQVVSFAVAFEIMPTYYSADNFQFLAAKLIAAIAAVAIAAAIAEPKEAKLQL